MAWNTSQNILIISILLVSFFAILTVIFPSYSVLTPLSQSVTMISGAITILRYLSERSAAKPEKNTTLPVKDKMGMHHFPSVDPSSTEVHESSQKNPTPLVSKDQTGTPPFSPADPSSADDSESNESLSFIGNSENDSDSDTFTVKLKSHSPKEISLSINAFREFDQLLDHLYEWIRRNGYRIRPIHYGDEWILINTTTKKSIPNFRMEQNGKPGDCSIIDTRPLGDVGIVPGSKLEVQLASDLLRAPVVESESNPVDTSDSNIFTVVLKSNLPIELSYSVNSFDDFEHLLDTLFVWLRSNNYRVRPFHYGDEWILINTTTNERIPNLRMSSKRKCRDSSITDTRPLDVVGIVPGTILELKLLKMV